MKAKKESVTINGGNRSGRSYTSQTTKRKRHWFVFFSLKRKILANLFSNLQKM